MTAPRLARGAAAPLAVAGAVVAVALLALASGAAAHVTVRPGASRPADLQRYTFLVPNERGVATTAIRIQVPAGIDFLLVERPPGWRAETVRRGGSIRELRFSGGRIEPDEYLDLHVVARNPVRTGTLAWPALQTYADGKVARWIGPPGGDEPAPRVKLSETAPPVDLVSTHGESPQSVPAAGRPRTVRTPAATAPTEVENGRDALTLVLAGAALAVASVALAIVVLRRRPSESTPSEERSEAW